MDKVVIKSGNILLSEPFSEDPNFRRTVVLLCEHHKEGTIGFILNRPLELDLSEAVPDLEGFRAKLYFGGPVQTDTMHFLHDLGDIIEDSVKVTDNVYWGGNFEVAKSLIQQKEAKSSNFRFFLGYSGWGKKQLYNEVKHKSWFMNKGNHDHIFKNSPKNLWKKILKDMGGDYEVVSNFPDDPSLN